MRSFMQDVGYFVRSVRKAPGFFAVAVLTLALGIGANTAIFSVIDAVMIRPLPFDEPERLVRLFETEAAPGNYPFAGPDYLDWKAQNRTLEGMTLIEYFRRANVSASGQAESALAMRVESNFFTVLGARPLVGRALTADDGAAGPARVAVVSHGFWQRFFGGDPAVIGRSLDLDAERYTVVGVMPAWFNYPRDVEAWTPLDMSPQNLGPRGSHSFLAIGRLKRGVTAGQALADLSVIAKRLEQQFPDSNDKVGAALYPMQAYLARPVREPLFILLGAVALVLLVACANVANLLLVRSASRRRELAIRSALGAGRSRIVRQLLTESVLLALGGALAGLAVAWGVVRLLQSIDSLPLPTVNPIRIDGWVLLFTLAVAALTGIVFGMLPAVQASASGPAEQLKAASPVTGGSGRGARRWRDAIAVVEIALSVALLVGAGLLLRSFDRLRHTEIGADARQVVTMTLNLPATRYTTPTARRAFFDRLLERVRSSPGVGAAAVSTRIPIEGGSNGYITVPGQDDSRLRKQLFEWNYVSADYLRTFKIPLKAGRPFDARDEDRAADLAIRIAEVFSAPNPALDRLRGSSWPAIVSAAMAELVWPGQDPIGRSFMLGDIIRAEVVGVAGDVKNRDLREDAAPQAYFAFPGALSDASPAILSVQAAGGSAPPVGAIRGHVRALDPTLAVSNVRTMDEVVADGMAGTTLQARLLSAFAALAVVMAAIGLYSVMGFLVAQRRHELGVRIALGAGRRELLRLVVAHAAGLVAVGVVLGLAAALGLAGLMRGVLFGVAAADPATFGSVAGLVAAVASAACVVPARRAMRVSPIQALRQE